MYILRAEAVDKSVVAYGCKLGDRTVDIEVLYCSKALGEVITLADSRSPETEFSIHVPPESIGSNMPAVYTGATLFLSVEND